MLELPTPRIHTVTEITRSIKGLLETEFPFITVAGEISNLRQPYSGHLYFTLKDENSQLRAVMFKTQQRYLADKPADGMRIVCRGRISVYEARGEYQLLVDFIEFQGSGALQLAFEQLKRRLAEEGLFAEENKKALPLLPSRIALITSPTGAAVHDFLSTATARFPGMAIEIFPVRVQGDDAAHEIVAALEVLNQRKSSNVIVLCRGGGSLEDLWSFNEETVARAIYASKIPVVSAVGHEIDYSISDFVADHRAPTPTAAAEMVVPDYESLRDHIAGLRQTMLKELKQTINDGRQQLESQTRMLGDPRSLFPHFMLRLDHSVSTMSHAFQAGIIDRKTKLDKILQRLHGLNPVHRVTFGRKWLGELDRHMKTMIKVRLADHRRDLNEYVGLLEAVNPLAVLGRGYAVVRTGKKHEVVRSSLQTGKGKQVEVLLHKGKIDCLVTGTTPPEKPVKKESSGD